MGAIFGILGCHFCGNRVGICAGINSLRVGLSVEFCWPSDGCYERFVHTRWRALNQSRIFSILSEAVVRLGSLWGASGLSLRIRPATNVPF